MIEVCSTNKCCRSFAGGEQTPAPAPAPAKLVKTPAPVHITNLKGLPFQTAKRHITNVKKLAKMFALGS